MNKANCLVWLTLALAACAGDVPLQGLPCPCATGYECCEYTNRCVASGATCAPAVASKRLGSPCDLSVDAWHNQGAYNASATDCSSHLCVKPVVQSGASGAVDTVATCTAECSQDSDCQGAELRDMVNPIDKRCDKGYMCGVAFEIDALSCKKLCVCRDFEGAAGLPTPMACLGTGNPNPVSSVTGVGQDTEVFVDLAPTRQLDLVVMVDNSPGMATKVGKLDASFSTLIDALKDPDDGTLPDLRVAIIDSDLGTGNAYASGSCGPKTLPDGSSSPYGDLGRFQMIPSPTPCTFNAGAEFLDYKAGNPLNYSGDINTVFACLASNLGTLGCGEEHQLQAFEFALVAKGVGNEKQQADFLRGNARLGLVFLSDEDDCSAAMNDGMFGDKPDLRGESASLRCATRSHRCGGLKLTASPPGYPTDSSFTHPFNDCQARTDSCPNAADGSGSDTDTSVPTDCSPLKSIGTLANELKALKADPDNQILVAGIFGWPLTNAAMATAQYKIAPIPNPNTADTQHPTVFDYWPVCYDPNHMPSPATTDPATGFDATAAAWGATGGLRESAFVDEFGPNGLKFSVCEPDLTQPMQTIGKALTSQMQNLCFNYKLVDADLATPGIQGDCRVFYQTPATTPTSTSTIVYQEYPVSMPQCPAGATNDSVSMDCWQLVNDTTKCPTSGQRITVLRTAAEIQEFPTLPANTRVRMLCRTCPALASGSASIAGCDY